MFSLPDAPRPFPPTRYSAIADLRAADPGDRERARTTLAETYWKPVYSYLRLRWRRDPDDAADLTQSFFLAALEKEFLAGYDPTRARFRTFLRTCLDRHVQHADESHGRLKRGGGVEHLSLDFAAAEATLPTVADPSPSPDSLFDREWLRALMEEALRRLREECDTRDRSLDYRLFVCVELADDAVPRPTYRELAAAEGVTEVTVTNRLAAARRDFRRILLEQLRAITGSESEFREEARALLGLELRG
jgi:RNA polymerase sigma factor (sigma-70 family)